MKRISWSRSRLKLVATLAVTSTREGPTGRVACTCAAMCAASLFALGTTSATYASPAFYECAKAAGGKFSKGCTTEGGRGGYELRPGIGKGKKYKGKGGPWTGDGLFSYYGEKKVTCPKFTFTGMPAGGSEVTHFTMKFSRCTFEGQPATSPGQRPGVIVTSPLAGELGYLGEEGTKVGLRLYPEEGELFETFSTVFEGRPVTLSITGSLYGEVSTVNQFTKTLSVTFNAIDGIREFDGFTGNKYGVDGEYEYWIETSLYPGDLFAGASEGTIAIKGEDLEVKA